MKLNGPLIARRRQELGMTHRSLAKEIGANGSTIGRIELGHGHGALSLAFVQRLIDVLAVDVTDLIEKPAPTEVAIGGQPDLPARLGALLRETDVLISVDILASATSSTIDEVDSALGELDQRLRPCGMRIHKTHNGVGVRTGIDEPDAVKSIHQAHNARRGLNATEARLLRRIWLGNPPGANQRSNPDEVALNRLRRAGLVDAGWMTITENVRRLLPPQGDTDEGGSRSTE